MKIMTWNVDWFRKCKRSGEEWEYKKEDIQNSIKCQIENEVQHFLEEDNTIAFLQEIPDFNSINIGEGNESAYYNRKANMHTIAVFSKNSGWTNETDSFFKESIDYYNRIVVLKKNDIRLVGVHIPDLHRQKTSDKETVEKLWKKLIAFIKEYKPDVICGDFNTDSEFDLLGKKIPQYELMEELKKCGDGYFEAQGSATRNKTGENPTFRGITHVDYILVKEGVRTISYDVGDIILSDHQSLTAVVDI